MSDQNAMSGPGDQGDAAARPKVEQPSNEVERPAGAARMPGAPRDNYTKMPTGPVGVEPVVASGPADTAGTPAVQWAPNDDPAAEDNTRLAPWALLAAIVALCASWFVGWGIPLAVVAIVAAIMSLRRPVENREIALWALILGIAATVYSLGWLIWAGMQFENLA
ncbi:hypothetical protein [Microbacterium sp.]|uniref:hypothetical protein n=1 Tax=Microbacterium sp. TaxID=51671 RepID=UPI002735F3B4|nr:hypothetical protein [Microbacterium sp.]MDP3953095.1 hypothetical protein [Microbacterium sp.]